MQRINLNLTRNGTSWPLVLDLDDSQFSQKLILDHLTNKVVYEPETAKVIDQILQPGDTFLDIGGHVGFFSVFASNLVGPTGRVYTFEPEPANFQHLLHHIALNKISNIFPLNWAVGHTSSVANLFVNLDNDGGHALYDLARNPACHKTHAQPIAKPVFVLRLDDLFSQAAPGSLKMIKIDTEGNETDVLKGAVATLQRAQVPAVLCEINRFGLSQLGSSEYELRMLMANLGYTSYGLDRTLPRRLQPNESLDSDFVFNLLFLSPAMQNIVREKWPQSTDEADKLFPPGEPWVPQPPSSVDVFDVPS